MPWHEEVAVLRRPQAWAEALGSPWIPLNMSGDTNSVLIASRITAYDAAIRFVKTHVDLPNQVFTGAWSSFLFCEPDWLFRPSFVIVVQKLLTVENATSCCILNLSLTKTLTFDAADAFYVDASTRTEDYKTRLFTGGGDAWISSGDHFACSSDSENWVIYCAKDEDLAIIAIRDAAVGSQLKAIFDEVRVTSLDVYIERPDSGPYPALPLTEAWKSAIIKNYSTGLTGFKSD